MRGWTKETWKRVILSINCGNKERDKKTLRFSVTLSSIQRSYYWEVWALGSWGNCPELQGLGQVNELGRSTVTVVVHKKSLRRFHVCKQMLFCQSAVEGAISSQVLSLEEQNMLTRLWATVDNMSSTSHIRKTISEKVAVCCIYCLFCEYI